MITVFSNDHLIIDASQNEKWDQILLTINVHCNGRLRRFAWWKIDIEYDDSVWWTYIYNWYTLKDFSQVYELVRLFQSLWYYMWDETETSHAMIEKFLSHYYWQ